MHAATVSEGLADLEIIDRPEVRSIGEFAAYWDGKRAGRRAPRRADIDPAEIKPHLPHVFMVDVLEGGTDFRYRLIGTAITRGLGRDNTGKRVSELYESQPEARARLCAYFRFGIEARAPIFSRGRVFWASDAGFRRFASCLLPLSDDGAAVNILLAELFVEHGGALGVPDRSA